MHVAATRRKRVKTREREKENNRDGEREREKLYTSPPSLLSLFLSLSIYYLYDSVLACKKEREINEK